MAAIYGGCVGHSDSFKRCLQNICPTLRGALLSRPCGVKHIRRLCLRYGVLVVGSSSGLQGKSRILPCFGHPRADAEEHSKSDEIATRTAFLTISGQVGNMCAGAMMAAIHEGLDGRAGLRGWQWVFVIDGIITCPIALFGLAYFPDLPETTKAPYLNKFEREIALNRLPAKRPDGHDTTPWSLVKRVLGKPTV